MWQYIFFITEVGSDRRIALATISRDITERKRAEEALRRAREELEQRVAERTRQLAAANGALRKQVAARKQAQHELRRSEAYLAEGQRLTRTGSWAWNISSGEIFWSREQFRIFALDEHAFTPSFAAVMQLIHPDDRPCVQQTLDNAKHVGGDLEWSCRIVAPRTGR